MSQLSAALEENTLLYMHLRARLSFVNLQNRKGSVALDMLTSLTPWLTIDIVPQWGNFPNFPFEEETSEITERVWWCEMDRKC